MIDYTPIVVEVCSGLLTITGIVATALVKKYVTDTTSATALNNAIGNSLGAVQNAEEAMLKSHPLQAQLPSSVSPAAAAGVQYVLDHAGAEAARFGITPAAIADKINARMGLTKMQANIANMAAPKITMNTAPGGGGGG